jgi:hypothetical protein
MIKNKLLLGSIFVFSLLFIGSCKKADVDPPTKTLMQGTWELTAATNGSGQDILATVAFPVTAIQLTDDNGMLGTQGPLFTYAVYGGSQWVTASAKIKQAFDYANFRFNTGEYFVEAGNPTHFTVEAKLQATASIAGGLTDVLTILGVDASWLQQTIYHKFINVKVTLPKADNTTDRNTMIWEFDNQTTAAYNYKDSQGNSIIWGGWPVGSFSKGKFTFTKRISGLNDIVRAHI